MCDRTLQVQNAIVDAIAGVDDCNDVTSTQLAEILVLTVSDTGTTKLKSGDFAGLTHAGVTIGLADNELQTLPANIFVGISPHLSMGGNPFGKGLPPALIADLKTRTSHNIIFDLVFVQDTLPTAPLALTVGNTMDVDLEDAFFYAAGFNVRSPANNYEITVADTSAATAEVNGHRLTIAAVSAGQTDIDIAGVQTNNGRKATQTLTVQVTDPAQDSPVCMRTQQVQDAIVAAIAGVSACNDVTNVHLAAISVLRVTDTGITELQSGDFAGLTNTNLVLTITNTQLQTLPADIFSGISPVFLDIRGNPFGEGLPSALIADLKTKTDNVNISLNLVFVQDTLPDSLELTVGNTMDVDLEDAFFYSSLSIRNPADSYEITVADTSAAMAAASSHTLTITAVSAGQTGIDIAGVRTLTERKATQTLTVQVTDPAQDSPVCMRTQQVQDAIVAAIAGVSVCNDVTNVHLAAISVLNVTDTGITELKSGDFAGLTNPALGLHIVNTQLQTLPADIFAGISPVLISLQNNPFGEGLPLALIADLKTRTESTINVDLVFVQDTLPDSLELTAGSTMGVDLEDAFFYAVGLNTRNPANSYEITVADTSVATATAAASSHTLTIAAVSAGQTAIDIVGVQTDGGVGVQTDGGHKATQTLTVEVPAETLKFRIKVFLEGAQ